MEAINLYLQNASGTVGLQSLPLAMAYVPMQKWENIYDEDSALMRGTIFRALDKPFLGREPKNHD